MKKLLSFLVLFTFAFSLFASTSDFVDKAPSLSLEKIDYASGDGVETAYYASTDERIVSIVSREKMDSGDWEELEKQYIGANTDNMFSHGLKHYYVCDSYDDEAQCFVDLYSGGYYYTIDVSVLNSDAKETMNIATVISASTLGEPPQLNEPPKTPDAYKPDIKAPDTEKPDSGMCVPGVFLAMFSGFAIFRK